MVDGTVRGGSELGPDGGGKPPSVGRMLGLGTLPRMLGGGGRWLGCGVCVAEPSSGELAGRERTGGGGGPPERTGGGGGWGIPNGGVLGIGEVFGAA